MITVVEKDGLEHRNLDGEVVRDGTMLSIVKKGKEEDDYDKVIAEFNDSWAHWYEQSREVRQEV